MTKMLGVLIADDFLLSADIIEKISIEELMQDRQVADYLYNLLISQIREYKLIVSDAMNAKMGTIYEEAL